MHESSLSATGTPAGGPPARAARTAFAITSHRRSLHTCTTESVCNSAVQCVGVWSPANGHHVKFMQVLSCSAQPEPRVRSPPTVLSSSSPGRGPVHPPRGLILLPGPRSQGHPDSPSLSLYSLWSAAVSASGPRSGGGALRCASPLRSAESTCERGDLGLTRVRAFVF